MNPPLQIIGWLFAGIMIAPAARGQQQVDLTEESPARMRTIELTKIASIRMAGLGEDFAGDERISSGTLTRAGKLYLSFFSFRQREHEHRLFVFDAHGKLLKRIGRRGEGPGEFRHLRWITTGPGDSVFVKDGSRFTVLANDEYQRSFESPVTGSFAMLRNGSIVVQSRLDLRFRTIDANGKDVAKVPHAESPLNHWDAERPLDADDEHVWVAYPSRYQFDQWTPDGKLVATYAMKTDWFPAWKKGQTPDSVPLTKILHVRVDQAGLIWLFFSVPTSKTDLRKYEIRVEVVDPKVRKVVARRTFDFYATLFDGLLAARVKEDDQGFTTNELYRFDLR